MFTILIITKNGLCILTVIKGHKIKTHRIILALRSPVFSKMLSVESEVKKRFSEIEIDDIDYEIMEKKCSFHVHWELPIFK